ncbi:hypothetical protein C8Q73DRAFT_716973 [Cubamyces lactineus]|nr:hypothetical protein C8Q73DRAFT_716973 [Cubamyces lactineus]
MPRTEEIHGPTKPRATPPRVSQSQTTVDAQPDEQRSTPRRSRTPPHSSTATSRAPPTSSLLTTATMVVAFLASCFLASSASARFALYAARPVYGAYPPLVAAMLVGGVCALICYLPTMLGVACFAYLFDTDIRKGGTPPPGVHIVPSASCREMLHSLVRDGADTIKVALIVAPLYVMAMGGSAWTRVESRALEAAAGGQLAAALMTLRIMLVGMKELWSLIPLVVFRLDRDSRRQREGLE